jgi:hypothetical protein
VNDDPVCINQIQAHRLTGGRREASRRSRTYRLSSSASVSFHDPAAATIPALERATASAVGLRSEATALLERSPASLLTGIKTAICSAARRRTHGSPDRRTSSAILSISGRSLMSIDFRSCAIVLAHVANDDGSVRMPFDYPMPRTSVRYPSYGGSSKVTSARRARRASLAETIGSWIGQGMPKDGSFQRMPRSSAGE